MNIEKGAKITILGHFLHKMENFLTKPSGKKSKITIFIKMTFSNIILVLNFMLISMQKTVFFNFIYYILSYNQKYEIRLIPKSLF